MIKTTNNKQLIRLFTLSCFTLLLSLISTNALAVDPTNTLEVRLISGASNNPIPEHQVTIFKRLPDGTKKWIKKLSTNEQGVVHFLLADLIEGGQYILKAKNPFDSRNQYSEVSQVPGNHTFVLGNKLLKINLINGITNQALPQTRVDIYKHTENNELKWARRFETDSLGHFDIDLPDLGSGINYVLKTRQLYGSGSVYSKKVTQTGVFDFKVGNLQVNLLSGATESAIPTYDVSVYEKLDDESFKWRAKAASDEKGIVNFHLPGLGEGRQYVLKAKNPFDSRYKTSQVIKQTGSHSFVLGHKLLNVHLINALDQKEIADIEVTAYLQKDDGSLEWFRRSTTDESGQTNFELPGLDKGFVYVLKAYPYDVKVYSTDIKETGKFNFPVGHVPVQLNNVVTGQPFPAQALTLYEKDVNGKLLWRAKSETDSHGIVRFDPVGLDRGRIYVVKAKNLFGNNQNYYSQWIAVNGNVDFTVGPDSPHRLDLEPPTFTAISPNENATLSDKGFVLNMRVSDNQAVDRLLIRITDPLLGTSSGNANIQNGEWQFTATETMLSADQIITVEVDAFDKVGNKTTVNRKYKIIKDLMPPKIIVTSHQPVDQINENGFLLLGSISDNSGSADILAIVTDPVLGVVVDNKPIEIGKNGNWALAVRKLSRKETVHVQLTATDFAGNQSVSELNLDVMTEAINASQLLNRITFGSTPELLTEVQALGAESFLSQQLQPELIDDTEANTRLAELENSDIGDRQKLQYQQIIRSIYSKRQLLEVMTWFWDNHFNTNLAKVGRTAYEQSENNAFRKHALGNFRDLLQVSASSPAMLVYLDNKNSRKEDPNENYPRELLELHSLGVDNFYTSQDVSEVARVFTGWRIRDRNFYFDSRRHDDDEKTVLGEIIPAGSGIAGGEQVLDILANHQGTADYICTKLLQVFVSDTPTADSINACADSFILNANQNDQIAQVLNGIFHSPEFNLSSNFHNKIKTPLEFVIGFARHLPIHVSYRYTENRLTEMGMKLYYNPVPTGYAETGKPWVDSNQLLLHWQFPAQILNNRARERHNHIVETVSFFTEKRIETTEGVIGYLFSLAVNHDYSQLEWDMAVEILSSSGNQGFDIYAEDADEKIRAVMATVFNSPSYQLQ